MKNLKVINKDTGEILPIAKIKKQELEEYIETLTIQERSEFLTQANLLARFAKNVEKTIKDRIKEEELDFDETETAFYGDWRVKKIHRNFFDEKKLEEQGSDVEKKAYKIYKQLKDKYLKTTSYIKFG